MKIKGKEYRNIKPIERIIENDVQGGEFRYREYIYMYFYDDKWASISSADVDNFVDFGEFNHIDENFLIQRRENLNKQFTARKNPSVGEYVIVDNRISIKWRKSDHKNETISFKGILLADGNIIKGYFFNETGDIVDSERLYHNIEAQINLPLDQYESIDS